MNIIDKKDIGILQLIVAEYEGQTGTFPAYLPLLESTLDDDVISMYAALISVIFDHIVSSAHEADQLEVEHKLKEMIVATIEGRHSYITAIDLK